MTGHTNLSIALALLCVVSLGLAATTLDSTLETDPDDVINPSWEQLPLSEDQAGEIEQSMQESEEEARASDDQREEQQQDERQQEQQQNQQAQQEDEAAAQNDEGDDGTGYAFGLPSLWELFLLLLRQLLQWLLVIILVAAAATLAWRYRDTFRALVASPDRERATEATSDDRPRDDWPPDPQTPVDEAWIELVYRSDVDRPATKTTRELAAAAVDSGMDPDAVDAIARTVEEINYGAADVTADRRHRVQEAASQLHLDVAARGRLTTAREAVA